MTRNEIWNLPCKMIYSANPVTLGDRIEEGIDQLIKHEADYGIVVVGISNRIDHNSFMPLLDKDEDIWGSFPSQDRAMNYLEKNIQSFIVQVKEQGQTRFIRGKNSTKFRGVLLIAHTICGIGRIPATLSAIGFVNKYELFDLSEIIGPEIELCNKLNNCAQTIFAR